MECLADKYYLDLSKQQEAQAAEYLKSIGRTASQSKNSDGHDLITFKKAKEDGTVVEEEKYKIVGNEPQHIG